MDKLKRYKELLKKRESAREKLNSARMRLGHPHLDFMSAHDLAESEVGVYTTYLEDIEKEILELEKTIRIR